MAAVNRRRASLLEEALAVADVAAWCLALGAVALVAMSTLPESSPGEALSVVRGEKFAGERRCEEIYVVGEGETLHTISDKCGDPFIVERNPHVHDPDDVFPGLVLKLAPLSTRAIAEEKEQFFWEINNKSL